MFSSFLAGRSRGGEDLWVATLDKAGPAHIGEITEMRTPRCKKSMKPRRRTQPRGGKICSVTPTVLIVDDHADFRRLARRVLEASGLMVVGEAADGMSAVAAARALAPELVLLDVVLPDSDGFAVAEQIAQVSGRVRVVLTSSRELDELRSRLERSPARGFLAKDDLSGEALLAVAGEP